MFIYRKINKFSPKYVGKILTTRRCTIRGCNESIRTESEGNIFDQPLTHTHEGKVDNVTAHKLQVSKYKGLEDFETPPSKIVRQTLPTTADENVTIMC